MEVCKWDVCFSSVIRPSIHRTEKPKSKVMALWNWLVRVFAVNRLFYKVDNLSHFNFFLFGLILWIKFVLTGWLRSVIADYGVPLMVVVWTGVSYMPSGDVPKGIPRRLFSPNPWSPGAYENWTVIKACLIDLYIEYFPPLKMIKYWFMYFSKWQDMLNVPIVYIIGAFIPATMIAVLYYFDHSVASQLAQQKEFNLRKPSSYHYDLLLLGFLVCSRSSWSLTAFTFIYSPCVKLHFNGRPYCVDLLESLHLMVSFHNLQCIPRVWLLLNTRYSSLHDGVIT